MNVIKWLAKNTSSLEGKKIAVTGSTGGIGVELCDYLASLGASLVLLDRNEDRSRSRSEKLSAKYGNEVKFHIVDLEDIISVDNAVSFLLEEGIDIFIHNAGAYSIPRCKTSCGYDNVYQINYASPYYIIRKILPMLNVRCGRVVVVGSIAHNYSKIDENDIDFHSREAASLVYGNAKRYLMFGLEEIMREEKNVSLSITHPGITFTNITAHYPKLIFAIIKHPMKVIFMKPRLAALSILKGVFDQSEYGSWIGPGIFNIWGLPKKQQLNTCNSSERKKIAFISEQVYNHCCDTLSLKEN